MKPLISRVVLLPLSPRRRRLRASTTRRLRGGISTRFSTRAARRRSTRIVAPDVVFRNPPAVVKGHRGISQARRGAARRVSRSAFHARRRARRRQQGGDPLGDARHAGHAENGRQRDGHFSHRERENQRNLGEHGFAGASAADGHRAGTMMKRSLVLCVVVALCSQAAAQQPPSADRALAREILEELVEIPTTQEDGTARAAQAMAARLAAAGFPKEDVQIIDDGRERRQCGRALSGTEPRRARRSADGAHRRRARAARRLVGRSVDVSRARRLVLRPRLDRQQGRRGDARRQLHHVEARRMAAGPRSHHRR